MNPPFSPPYPESVRMVVSRWPREATALIQPDEWFLVEDAPDGTPNGKFWRADRSYAEEWPTDRNMAAVLSLGKLTEKNPFFTNPKRFHILNSLVAPDAPPGAHLFHALAASASPNLKTTEEKKRLGECYLKTLIARLAERDAWIMLLGELLHGEPSVLTQGEAATLRTVLGAAGIRIRNGEVKLPIHKAIKGAVDRASSTEVAF